MNTAKRVSKALACVAAAVLGLSILAYGVLLVANLHDQPPSPSIAGLRQMDRPATTVADDDNSYLFMLGFAVPPDTDPLAMGVTRHQWIEVAGPKFDFSDDPLSDEVNFRSSRTAAVIELSESCSGSYAKCLRLIEQDPRIAVEWTTSEDWLLQRYRTLTNMPDFQETIPFEPLAPMPSYNVVFEGQRLMLMDTWLRASLGDATAVNAALERDLTFWRMVLRNSDVLVTKLTATAAIIRHFKMGNFALRRLPPSSATDGIPDSWRVAITNDERSMKRSFAGEWAFFERSTKSIIEKSLTPFSNWLDPDAVSVADRIAANLLAPLWQPQDSSNRYADMLLSISDAFRVEYDQVPVAVAKSDKIQKSAFRPFRRLYNFTGDLVMSTGGVWAMSDYAARVADLEGVRRAAMLATDLRAEDTVKDDVVQKIRGGDVVDPYTGDPFSWDDSSGAIVFTGLEQKDRSRHEIIY